MGFASLYPSYAGYFFDLRHPNLQLDFTKQRPYIVSNGQIDALSTCCYQSEGRYENVVRILENGTTRQGIREESGPEAGRREKYIGRQDGGVSCGSGTRQERCWLYSGRSAFRLTCISRHIDSQAGGKLRVGNCLRLAA